MIHTIQNDFFTASVTNIGAELCSIKSKKSGKEYMWQADSAIWGSFAPVLFPAIGSFKNEVCTIDGKEYKIPKHGFIRHNTDLEIQLKTESKLVLCLKYSEKTLKIYPYKFIFSISFELVDNRLIVNHTVENIDDKPIYFSLGGHPAFKCPINKGESYSDYFLEFEKVENAERTILSDNGLLTKESKLLLDNTNILNLTPSMFENDAIIFKELKSRKVSLKSRKSNQVLSVSFPDFEYLGIWAKPNAAFVCIEPWLGITDEEDTNGDFLKKDGLISLPIGETFEAEFQISIEE